MNKSLAQRCSRVHPKLPLVIIILCCFQPVLDIMSYWQEALELPFSLSFMPRTIVMALLGIGGFALSEHKRAYLIMAGVLAAFLGCHIYACYTNGFTDMVNDISNYIRVLQLPVTTISLITCLRCNEDSLDAIERGIFYSLILLAVSFVVSTATNTDPHTYLDRGVGVRGYAFWANSQSAILSLAAPVSIGYMIKNHGKKTLLCILTMILALLLLYLHATRLSFLCLVMTGVGMAVVVLLSKGTPKKYAWILLALTAISGACYKFSPMYTNQQNEIVFTKVKADASEALMELGEAQVENGNSPLLISRGLSEHRTGLGAFALSEPLKESTFNDVSENDWSSEYIAYCQTLGLANGINSTYDFGPGDDLTALAAVTFCDYVYERYTGTIAYPGYDGDTWYEALFLRAEAYGLMPEYVCRKVPEKDAEADETKEIAEDLVYGINIPVSTAEEIGTDTLITRAQAAHMLALTLGKEALAPCRSIESISDVPVDTLYYDDIMLLYRAGAIVFPGADTRFRPDDVITRREFISMLAAAVNPAFRKCDEGYTVMIPEPRKFDSSKLSEIDRLEAELSPLYNYFCTGLVGKFGVHDTMTAYEYTTDTTTLISEREWKLQFCYLLMKTSTPISQVFGLEVSRMAYNGTIYDVENDFHAMYLLYGIVGFALMLLFLGFFIFMIARALIKDFKHVFTVESGAIGIALLACIIHAYFTCGVLRRANVLFYFGALLAAAYYLTVIKKYPKEEK